ncbi:MAG TPA: hypothetical protein PLP17_15020, partial [Oligoflexia bacterium]|nr:hypothetical protein [Oligoflexia bacterium]
LAQAESAAARSVPVCIVKGGAGCGRNALAEFIHSQRRRPGVLTEIALDLWPGEATAIFGPSSSGGNSSLLSCAATVVIDHAEYDTGEILESAARLLQDTGGQKNETMLIIGTSVEETAQAWQRLTDAEIIEIPGLNARTEDFLPLMQRIHGEAARLYPIKAFEASSAFLRTLLAMSWPGNIKQFRSAVLEALTTTHFAPHSGALEGPDDAVRELLQIEDYAGLNTEERQIIAAIAEAKARWLRFRRASNYVPDTLAASSALEKANGNLRLAAAYLGTGILQLKSALQSSFGQQP